MVARFRGRKGDKLCLVRDAFGLGVSRGGLVHRDVSAQVCLKIGRSPGGLRRNKGYNLCDHSREGAPVGMGIGLDMDNCPDQMLLEQPPRNCGCTC